MDADEPIAAIIDNVEARAPLLLLCEHASNHIPPAYAGLGLDQAALHDHVAWDIGALALARRMARLLDATLIAAPASRLLIDANRDLDARDLIPPTAEGRAVPGNQNLTAAQRAARVRAYHAPFHEAVAAHLRARAAISALISVHSFTPILFGAPRPWHAGVLHGGDTRLADVMLEVLSRESDLKIGRNQPYAPSDGVFYTMARHAGARATAMIEVRNDLIADDVGQARWADRLAEAVNAAMPALNDGESDFGLAGKRS